MNRVATKAFIKAKCSLQLSLIVHIGPEIKAESAPRRENFEALRIFVGLF